MRFFILLLFMGGAIALHTNAQSQRVLFIGNSYTYYNDLPQLLTQLAASAGEAVTTGQSTPPGHTLEQHSTNPATLDLIRQGDWDHVIIQEQSQRPAFPDGQVATQVLPYAQALVDSVRAYSPCANVVFYMTWGRQNGDAQNCVAFPPVCTYEGMQERLRSGYLAMATANQAECAPVGMAWRTIRQQHPSIVLYDPDGSHPALGGSYLAASTIFCTLFRRSASDLTFNAGLPEATAGILRQVASSTVLDSLVTWNIGVNDPEAGFLAEQLTGTTFSFTSSASAGEGYTFWWDLGDGSTASDGTLQHTFPDVGSYTVVHTVTDSCGRSDSTSVTIAVHTTGIADQGLLSTTALWWSDGQRLYTSAPHMHEGVLQLHGADGKRLSVLQVVNGEVAGPSLALDEVVRLFWTWSDGRGRHERGRLLPRAGIGR